MKKKFGFLIFLSCVAGFVHFYIPRFIVEIDNPLVNVGREVLRPDLVKQPEEDLMEAFEGYEGTLIRAHLSQPTADTLAGTLLLIHGIAGNHHHYDRVLPLLNTAGYQTIAVDLRAHGTSGGQYCTFGVKEKEDLSLMIDSLTQAGRISTQLGIWGHSLGGAVALQAMAHDKRILYGIVESTFSDFPSVVGAYQQDYIGFDFRQLAEYLSGRAAQQAGFTKREASPASVVGGIDQPILLVHGTQDTKIDSSHASANYKALGSQDKRLLMIEGAGHMDVWEKGGEEYLSVVMNFIRR